MKPFSKFEAISGAPVTTRNGKPVTQLKEFETKDAYQIAGVLDGVIQTWTDDGLFCAGDQEYINDLVMAGTKKEGWIAFGPDNRFPNRIAFGFCTHVWETEEEAKCLFYVANKTAPAGTMKVSWEE